MAGKGFKNHKPQDTIASGNRSNGASGEYIVIEVSEKNNKPQSYSKPKRKTNSDYLRLDIYGYKDYLSTMAGFRKMSVTKYIQKLIDKDMEQNKNTYEKIRNI